MQWKTALLMLSLVTLPAALPTTDAQAADTAALLLEDPAGDVQSSGLFLPGTTPAPPLDHIDIRTVRIGSETPNTFDITIDLEAWSTVSRVAETASVGGMDCYVSWSYGSDAPYMFAANIRLVTEDAQGNPTFASALYYNYYADSTFHFTSTLDGQTLAYDATAHALTLTVEKAFVPVLPDARGPSKGDVLHLREASCYTDTAIFMFYYDFVEMTNARYAFTAAGAGDVVRVSFGNGRGAERIPLDAFEFPSGGATGPRISVAPGDQAIIPVRLENRIDEKRLVLLEARLLDAPAGWNATMAPSIFLKGEEVRIVNLIVTPPADAAFGDEVEVEVRAQVAGEGGLGIAARRLAVGPQLGDAHQTVHFHVEPITYPSPYEAIGTLFPAYTMRASLLASEEGFSDPAFGPGPLSRGGIGDALDPLGRPVRLPVEDATLQLAVTGEEAALLEVQFNVAVQDGELIYSSRGTYAPGTHAVPLAPLFDSALDLEPGTVLYFRFELRQAQAPFTAQIDPKATTLTLPAQSLGAGLAVTDGRFLPNLGLAPGEERLTYVNPGKAYAFELVLANDGIEEDDLQVTVTSENATGWEVRVLPGARFRIPAGEATPLALEVVPAADTPEGATAVFRLDAVSKKDPDAKATLTLRAVATHGTDVEAKPFAEKEGQFKPLADDTEDTPAPWGGLAVLGALGVLLRRRRGL